MPKSSARSWSASCSSSAFSSSCKRKKKRESKKGREREGDGERKGNARDLALNTDFMQTKSVTSAAQQSVKIPKPESRSVPPYFPPPLPSLRKGSKNRKTRKTQRKCKHFHCTQQWEISLGKAKQSTPFQECDREREREAAAKLRWDCIEYRNCNRSNCKRICISVSAGYSPHNSDSWYYLI